ncbi:MAG: hypothetical protein ACRCS9_16330 [Hyphomicrobium sp.]
MSIDPKHAPYARETAICVDLAFEAMEEDIRSELISADSNSREILLRLLNKLCDRRKVLEEFTRLTTRAA